MPDYQLGQHDPNASHSSGVFGQAAQGLGLASSYNANAPNQQAYSQFANQQNAQQQAYQQQALDAQGRQGPTISNAGQAQSQAGIAGNQAQFGTLQNALNQDIQNPNNSMAVNQFRQATDQSIAAQQAQANSVHGGALAQAGAQRAAAQQGAQTLAGASAQSAQIAEQARMQAMGLSNSVAQNSGQLGMAQYGLEQQNAQQQAQLQQQQGAQNNAYSLGLGALGQGAAGQQLGAINGSSQEDMEAQRLNAQTQANAAQSGTGLFQGLLQGAGMISGTDRGGK